MNFFYLDLDFYLESGVFPIPSPLEQFEIIPFLPMKIGDLYFSFTNPSLFMLLTLSLVLLLVHFVTKKGGGKSVPNAWQSLVELIYDFVPNLVNEQIGGLSGNVKQQFFRCIAFHRARIALFYPDYMPIIILFIHLVVCLSAVDVATCDVGGGVEGPPSPPVVGIRVAPEVLEVPPAAPEVWEVPPAAPEVPVLDQPLYPDPQREAELYSRFLVNTIGENPTLRRITDTISVHNEIERLIEAALVRSGFDPVRVFQNRHRIRGFLFYPRGRAISLRQYRAHLR
jgi:hypothetical protein